MFIAVALLERARMLYALLERAAKPNIERSESLANANWRGLGYNQSTEVYSERQCSTSVKTSANRVKPKEVWWGGKIKSNS